MDETPDIQAGDLWSIGCILYTLLYGELPFGGKTDQETWESIANMDCSFHSDSRIHEKAMGVVKVLLEKFSSKRHQVSSLLNDSWFINTKEKTWN